jgi:hypothetical protein
MSKDKFKKDNSKESSNKIGIKCSKNMDKKLIGYNSGFALYDKDGFIRP